MDEATYQKVDIFNLSVPTQCAEVPEDILMPRNSWSNKIAYDEQRIKLAEMFQANFEKFTDKVSENITAAAPKLTAVTN